MELQGFDARDPSVAAGRRSAGLAGLLEPGAIDAVFQPIVRLADSDVIGYEGLARFPAPAGVLALPPDVTLAAAERDGLRADLEVACWAAMAHAGAPPGGRLLFLNVGVAALAHPGFEALAGRLPARLVLELTDQEPLRRPGVLADRLRPWTARGAMVAVDDAGGGFASLDYVARLRPDFLKLPRAMVTGVDADPARRSVLRATVAFAHEVGAAVVAEGVEGKAELAFLRDADVDYAQGWLFGRPASAWPELAREPARDRRPRLLARRDRLERDLERADSVAALCTAVVEHLGRRGLMPSVYLLQGGRLRCVAQRGAAQVHDGVPTSAGMIGRAFRTHSAVVVDDVTRSADFVPTVPSVVAQLALPLEVDGRVVGVLAAEATSRPGAAAMDLLERCARELGTRLASFAPLDRPSAGQRLARTAVGLAAVEDPEDVLRETLAAARRLSGFESAAVALADGHGGFYVHLAEGSLSVAIQGLGPEELATIASWVRHGTSVRTMGDARGKGFAGHAALERAGADSLVVLPLRAAGERLGVLLLADRAHVVLEAEEVELLEGLATQAAGAVRMAAAVCELRERAARDPLTGLGHHAAFHAALPAARTGSLPGRRVAVLLADVDGFKGINDTHGHAAGDEVLRALAGVLRGLPGSGRAFRIGGDEFAVLADVGGEQEAERLGWELQSQVRSALGHTLSIGIALDGGAEEDTTLVARADAALYAVKRAGRDGVRLAA